MDFERAWNEKLVAATMGGEKNHKQNIQARINFEQGEATMVMPGYFKDENLAKDTLLNAWRTYCLGKEGIENSINGIIIEEVMSFDFIQCSKNSARKSA